LGNLIAAGTAYALAWIAQAHGGDYAFAQSAWIVGVVVVLALLTWFGPEAHGVRFGVTAEGGATTMRDSPIAS
jgi:SHS family lactate transporter-like MFS transporter